MVDLMLVDASPATSQVLRSRLANLSVFSQYMVFNLTLIPTLSHDRVEAGETKATFFVVDLNTGVVYNLRVYDNLLLCCDEEP